MEPGQEKIQTGFVCPTEMDSGCSYWVEENLNRISVPVWNGLWCSQFNIRYPFLIESSALAGMGKGLYGEFGSDTAVAGVSCPSDKALLWLVSKWGRPFALKLTAEL